MSVQYEITKLKDLNEINYTKWELKDKLLGLE